MSEKEFRALCQKHLRIQVHVYGKDGLDNNGLIKVEVKTRLMFLGSDDIWEELDSDISDTVGF